jgi:hypothetical protein
MRTVDLFRAKPAEPGDYFILDQVTGQKIYIEGAFGPYRIIDVILQLSPA